MCVCVCVCVLCDGEETQGREIREKEGNRVTGLGGLLSILPGRQPSVHAILALRHCHIATTHAFMSCIMHYVTVFWPVIREVYTYFRHCMTTGFGPFNFPTRGQLWNRRDHSPASGVRHKMYTYTLYK